MAIRQNTNNEIVYVESNLYPLERNIKVQQLKLWKQINDESSRDTLLGKLITQAKEINIEFVNYYIQLEQQYNTLPEDNIKGIPKYMEGKHFKGTQ